MLDVVKWKNHFMGGMCYTLEYKLLFYFSRKLFRIFYKNYSTGKKKAHPPAKRLRVG